MVVAGLRDPTTKCRMTSSTLIAARPKEIDHWLQITLREKLSREVGQDQREDLSGRSEIQTIVPNKAPIPAVATMASAPQSITRVAALTVPAPPARAEMAPSNPRLISEAMETAGIALETGAIAMAASGRMAPTENVAAEVKAAWTGRELTVSEMPSSSRA